MGLGELQPPEDKFSPVDPIRSAQPLWIRAVNYPLRPLRQAARYLRLQAILQRRKRRKELKSEDSNKPENPSGFDKLA